MRRTLSYFGLFSLLACSVTSERLRRSSGYVGGGGFGFGGGGSGGFDYGGGGGGGALTGSLVNGFDAIHRGINVMLDKFHSGMSHFEDFNNRGGVGLGGGMGAGGGASSGGSVRDGAGLGGNDEKIVYVKSDDGRSGGFAFSGSMDGGNGRYGGGGGYSSWGGGAVLGGGKAIALPPAPTSGWASSVDSVRDGAGLGGNDEKIVYVKSDDGRSGGFAFSGSMDGDNVRYGGGGGYSSWGGGRSYGGGAEFGASSGGGVNRVKSFDKNQEGAGIGFGSGGFIGSVRPSGSNAGSGDFNGAGFGGSTGSRPSQGGSGGIIQGGVVLEPSPGGVCILEGNYGGNGNGHGVPSGAEVRRVFVSPDNNVPHLQPTSTYKQPVLQTKYQASIPIY